MLAPQLHGEALGRPSTLLATRGPKAQIHVGPGLPPALQDEGVRRRKEALLHEFGDGLRHLSEGAVALDLPDRKAHVQGRLLHGPATMEGPGHPERTLHGVQVLLDGPRPAWDQLDLALGLVGQDEAGRLVLEGSLRQVRDFQDGVAMHHYVRLVARQGPVAPPPASGGMIHGNALEFTSEVVRCWLGKQPAALRQPAHCR